jgi:hypothetical protein
MNLQLSEFTTEFDLLQRKYGATTLCSVYGAGCLEEPEIMFIFMNPTGRNITSSIEWKGLRAPWLGTKNVWRIFNNLKTFSADTYSSIQTFKPQEWTEDFCSTVYAQIAQKKFYLTNLAKCTQLDARPLKDYVFKEYLALMLKEIEVVRPKKIITFGNQVSSIVLAKKISVSNYSQHESETLEISGSTYSVFPTYYPVGQGTPNMPKAIERINYVLEL